MIQVEWQRSDTKENVEGTMYQTTVREEEQIGVGNCNKK